MKLKADWAAHLHELRRRELEIIFHRFPAGAFNSALELGAGDGFQSAILSGYAKSLTSTDYSRKILQSPPARNVKYMVCDAEKVAETFKPGSFDLVFSSNMLEHVPQPGAVLAGIRRVMKDDGLCINIMPSPFWKLTHLLLHSPNLLALAIQAVTTGGGLDALTSRAREYKSLGKTPVRPGNNPKTARKPRNLAVRLLLPDPHGASATNMEELNSFRQSRWRGIFADAGFDVIAILNGPVASGYGFGFDRLRSVLENSGLASEYIFVAVKSGKASPLAKYFRE
jgi:SAM-dependent methyltransferase